ncbi:MAG: Na/Pi cotransporter family protein [Lachnospiraceae bacterium]|nr:Na/Pi cotransporter family protein [Lachnospiraceae bacterium]
MTIFDVLSMIGGLALFLYGMHLLSEGLERVSGGRLERILEKMTNSKWKGVLLGAGVTAVIQSSSATTVMVVGFVNSGIMKLSQAIGVIMGANIGTTATAWILSLSGLESDNFWVQMLKPTSFCPILAIIGIVFIMFLKDSKKKDLGMIFVGFAILMFGMDSMSDAMKPLSSMPEFTQLFVMFSNPILGLLVGAILTAIIQSSSASVGILQALCQTGSVSFGSAIPIIMGQNIGTCITAIMSAVGAAKNAKRASVVHLMFNVIGTTVFMIVFYTANAIVDFAFLDDAANAAGIATVHTAFNIMTTCLLLPFSKGLEKLSTIIVKRDEEEDRQDANAAKRFRFDDRFLNSPSFALEQANTRVMEMAEITKESLDQATSLFFNYDKGIAKEVEEKEQLVDHYDDEISSYLMKLSAKNLSEDDSKKLTILLHTIGDLERISDHALNLVDAAADLNKKEQGFSAKAIEELHIFTKAVMDIVAMSVEVFKNEDIIMARTVEPFEEAIDAIQKEMKKRHKKRLNKGKCTVEMGFALSEITNNYERIADHCSNIAISVMQLKEVETHAHEYVDNIQKGEGSDFDLRYQNFLKKYDLP